MTHIAQLKAHSNSTKFNIFVTLNNTGVFDFDDNAIMQTDALQKCPQIQKHVVESVSTPHMKQTVCS